MPGRSAPKSASDVLNDKIDRSKMTAEMKELLKLLMSCFSTMIQEKNSALTALETKIA